MNDELSQDEFSLLLNSMPDNRGIFVESESGGERMKVQTLTSKDLEELGKSEELFHVVGQWTRPFVHYFANYVEYEHFPPEGNNNEMQYRVFRWHTMLWSIVSIPISKKELAYEAAAKSHLKLANGVPLFFGKEPIFIFAAARPETFLQLDSTQIFPLSNSRTFTLEQQKDDVVYQGPGGRQDAAASEEFEIQQLWKKHGKDKFGRDPIENDENPWE